MKLLQIVCYVVNIVGSADQSLIKWFAAMKNEEILLNRNVVDSDSDVVDNDPFSWIAIYSNRIKQGRKVKTGIIRSTVHNTNKQK